MTTAVKLDPVYDLALRMGDNALILGQRVSEWCGHAPVLEEDIAMANVGLDLIGQAKMWFDYAGAIEAAGKSADEIALLRDARAFTNALLVEQPNGDYAHTLMRQFLFDAWHLPMLKGLAASKDERIAEIAAKSAKEATYHLERSEDFVVSLGDGTAESHDRMQAALDALYPFAGELTLADDIDRDLAARGLAPDLSVIAAAHLAKIEAVITEATLKLPSGGAVRKGGKQGLHSEHLGFILADMQWLQRAYPGAEW
ncbi:MAG: 1,2-phenylacetyl-CoA epoxidase subunit PaaC [Parvularculaceae bacterium]